MFYHVLVEIDDFSKNNKVSYLYEFDHQSLDDIKEDILLPYSIEKRIYIDGRIINYKDIRRLKVFESSRWIDQIVDAAESVTFGAGFSFPKSRYSVMNEKYMSDVTKELLKSFKPSFINISSNAIKENNVIDNKKVFLVHGHDRIAELEVARFVESLGLEVIILHEQANGGTTLIQKIEKYSDVGFGIILYTPCDVGGLPDGELSPRARQNVIFEHGYLIGKLGRDRVAALVKSNIENPSDINGMVYIPYDDNNGWNLALIKELTEAGYDINTQTLFKK